MRNSTQPLTKSEIITTLRHMQSHPSMYIIGLKFFYFSNFLTGFLLGTSLMSTFRKFLRIKYETSFAVVWDYYVLQEVTNQDEALALKFSLELIGEFADFLEKEEVY